MIDLEPPTTYRELAGFICRYLAIFLDKLDTVCTISRTLLYRNLIASHRDRPPNPTLQTNIAQSQPMALLSNYLRSGLCHSDVLTLLRTIGLLSSKWNTIPLNATRPWILGCSGPYIATFSLSRATAHGQLAINISLISHLSSIYVLD